MWERNVIRTIYGLLLMAYIIRVTNDAGGMQEETNCDEMWALFL